MSWAVGLGGPMDWSGKAGRRRRGSALISGRFSLDQDGFESPAFAA
ncbi:hypothetical protein [Lysobacter enzymogenes]|nr:hypothetical protein [Lysobacter enzymogenes]